MNNARMYYDKKTLNEHFKKFVEDYKFSLKLKERKEKLKRILNES